MDSRDPMDEQAQKRLHAILLKEGGLLQGQETGLRTHLLIPWEKKTYLVAVKPPTTWHLGVPLWHTNRPLSKVNFPLGRVTEQFSALRSSGLSPSMPYLPLRWLFSSLPSFLLLPDTPVGN